MQSIINLTDLKNNFRNIQVSKKSKSYFYGVLYPHGNLEDDSYIKVLDALPHCKQIQSESSPVRFQYATSLRDSFINETATQIDLETISSRKLRCESYNYLDKAISASSKVSFDLRSVDQNNLSLSVNSLHFNFIKTEENYRAYYDVKNGGRTEKRLMALKKISDDKVIVEYSKIFNQGLTLSENAYIGEMDPSIADGDYKASIYLACKLH